LIVFDPEKLLRKYAPESKIEGLLKRGFTLNRALLSAFSEIPFVNKRDLTKVVLEVAKLYRKKYRGLVKEGEGKGDAKKIAENESKLLTHRIQNLVVFKASEKIKEELKGEFYIWLPSDADEPDPLHQLKYGKKFQIGKGEMPGERFGCRCGMKILTGKKDIDIV
jgi:hypothetical protein